MTFRDILKETYAALSANKARSCLTILGIVIGIASVISMVSIGAGAQKSIESSIEGLGSNLLTIMPGVVQPGRGIVSSGRGSAQTLKNEDARILEKIQGVAGVSPELSRRFQIIATNGNNTNTTVTGAQPAYASIHNLSVASGSFITETDARSIGRTAVLGATVSTDLFGETDPIGKTIRISGTNFRIIGVLTSKGGMGFSGPDDMIFVPLQTMQKILVGADTLSTISVSVADKNRMAEIQMIATQMLLESHNVIEADFSVISMEDILGAMNSIIGTFTLFLASIAGISLLVGGIGIMNMMLTSVTERIKEIGLRKAIGAKRSDINVQFLAEAIVLTTVGGVLGIALGWLTAVIINATGIVQASVSLSSVLLAVGVSAGIGILFGYYPARRAANLHPIDALRYE